MSGIGYVFGQMFPWAVKKLEVIILVVVFVSVLPAAIPIARGWLARRRVPKSDSGGMVVESPTVPEVNS